MTEDIIAAACARQGESTLLKKLEEEWNERLLRGELSKTDSL
jgi:hypothetical protein